MRIAAKVRHEKDAHPERFCAVPRCLWRVSHAGRPDTPCRKHPVHASTPHSLHTAPVPDCPMCQDLLDEAREVVAEWEAHDPR